MDKTTRNLLIIIAVLIILVPLGLIYAGNTFGEDSSGSLWNAPLSNYGFPGSTSTLGTVAGYVFSAVIGVAICGGVIYLLGKLVAKNE